MKTKINEDKLNKRINFFLRLGTFALCSYAGFLNGHGIPIEKEELEFKLKYSGIILRTFLGAYEGIIYGNSSKSDKDEEILKAIEKSKKEGINHIQSGLTRILLEDNGKHFSKRLSYTLKEMEVSPIKRIIYCTESEASYEFGKSVKDSLIGYGIGYGIGSLFNYLTK